MVQSSSCEANWFAASQEIPRISRKPKVHYRTHKLPPTISILDQPNPVHTPTSHLLEIHPNISHPSKPRSPQWSLSLWFPKKILEWKPIGTRIRGRQRKRWIVDIEEDTQIIGIRWWRKQCKEKQNGRDSLKRLKHIGGCNVSERRRRRRGRRRKRRRRKNKEKAEGERRKKKKEKEEERRRGKRKIEEERRKRMKKKEEGERRKKKKRRRKK